MALLLHIDTAQETASVCLSADGATPLLLVNENQSDHAAWLHVALQRLFRETGYKLADLEAVSVTIGPGSYTGLRVGLSTAKGLCYALQRPLLTVSTLDVMALAALPEAKGLICPLIDARRMEVFTALYDKELNVLGKPAAMILDENSFATELSNNKLIFCGSGRKKLQKLINHPNASWSESIATAGHLSTLAQRYFLQGKFADLAYTEPLYIKDFYGAPKVSS